ncbi:MAG: type II CAAX prenyl endopeptidase Rce1 family protein [Chloroflexota bacterium]
MTTKPFNWKIYFILLAASVFGVVAVLPYSLALQGNQLANLQLPMPIWLLITLQVLQNAVLFAVVIAVGLLAANRVGLGLPILEGWLAKEPVGDKVKSIWLPAVLIGVIGSALVIALDVLIFSPILTAEFGGLFKGLDQEQLQPAAWKGLLVSFYGGIDEELLLRLGLMSVLVWLGRFVSKTAEGRPTQAVIWTANILAAVLFGLGHLPATAVIMPLTPLVITRAIVLNGIIGVGAGYLYARRGLEAAILCHFSADIVLHVLLAL